MTIKIRYFAIIFILMVFNFKVFAIAGRVGYLNKEASNNPNIVPDVFIVLKYTNDEKKTKVITCNGAVIDKRLINPKDKLNEKSDYEYKIATAAHCILIKGEKKPILTEQMKIYLLSDKDETICRQDGINAFNFDTKICKPVLWNGNFNIVENRQEQKKNSSKKGELIEFNNSKEKPDILGEFQLIDDKNYDLAKITIFANTVASLPNHILCKDKENCLPLPKNMDDFHYEYTDAFEKSVTAYDDLKTLSHTTLVNVSMSTIYILDNTPDQYRNVNSNVLDKLVTNAAEYKGMIHISNKVSKNALTEKCEKRGYCKYPDLDSKENPNSLASCSGDSGSVSFIKIEKEDQITAIPYGTLWETLDIFKDLEKHPVCGAKTSLEFMYFHKGKTEEGIQTFFNDWDFNPKLVLCNKSGDDCSIF